MIKQLLDLCHQWRDGTFFDAEIAAMKVDECVGWTWWDFELARLREETIRMAWEMMLNDDPNYQGGTINDIDGAPDPVLLTAPISQELIDDLRAL